MSTAPTITARFDAESIAAHLPELVQLRQWVNWRIEERTNARGERKPTKVPVNARTGGNADSQAPGTWSGFELACERGRRLSLGVGFVFASSDPFFGIDLDKCLDGGHLAPWAREVAEAFGTYPEVTPSGTGLHLIGRGTMPESGRRKGQLEVYCSGRFFTMTGRAFRSPPPTVADCQLALDALYRRLFTPAPSLASAPAIRWDHPSAAVSTLRDKAAQGRIRRTTLALLDSTGGAGYESASEADAALAAGLIGAGLTGEEAYSLFRSSSRGQDAYARKGDAHGEYYVRRTIEHAAAFAGPVVERPEGLRLRLPGRGASPLRLARAGA